MKKNILVQGWLDVPGLLGYQVNRKGDVRTCLCQGGGGLKDKWRVLTQYPSSSGYLRVCIMGKKKYVHVLIAKTFLGSKPKGCQVDHIDGNKLNCRASNLQYLSPKENVQKACGKLTIDIVRKARIEWNNNQGKIRVEYLAKKYGVTKSAMSMAISGITWKNAGGPICDFNKRSGIPISVVRLARKMHRKGNSFSEISRRLGIDRETARRYALGIRRSDV